MCIKRFPLHQEGDIRHLFVVQEVGIYEKQMVYVDNDYTLKHFFNINILVSNWIPKATYSDDPLGGAAVTLIYFCTRLTERSITWDRSLSAKSQHLRWTTKLTRKLPQRCSLKQAAPQMQIFTILTDEC